jgi:glycerol-3-phosphate acyltransferase PlsY
VTQFVAFLLGYLMGSISGARIVGARYAAGKDLSRTRVVLDGTGASVENRGVSASSLQARGGARAGLRAGAIDIGKALIPTLAALLIWSDGPEYILAGAGALVGHVFPVYHRFLGGFGVSPLIGALLVIDFRAVVVSILLFGLLGLILGNAYLGIETWPIGLVPWFVASGDYWALSFAVLANLLYWSRSRHEAIGAWKAWRKDDRPWSLRVRDFKTYPTYEEPLR